MLVISESTGAPSLGIVIFAMRDNEEKFQLNQTFGIPLIWKIW